MSNTTKVWVKPKLTNFGNMIEMTQLSENSLHQIADVLSINNISLLASMAGF